MRPAPFFLSLLILLITPAAPFASGDMLQTDLRTFNLCRAGLERGVSFARSRPDIFGTDRKLHKGLLTRQDKMEVWGAWSGILDYVTALDAVGGRYAALSTPGRTEDRTSFSLRLGAFLAEYRFALEFISLAENNRSMKTVLDEAVPEFGLGKGSYSRFKFRFLNVARATEFTALKAVDKGLQGPDSSGLRGAMSDDAEVIWRMGKGRGPVLTFANGLNILGKAGFAAWFPVQKGVSEMMGDVKVHRSGVYLISQNQIREMKPRLQPGDILLERREWYLSNVGLPGFWTHAALYIGTPEERKAFFRDTEVREWVLSLREGVSDFESLLKLRYPSAYRTGSSPQADGHLPRILEAISEGVSFTTLEHSAAADSLAVLRPRLSKREKALAVLRAFHYSGRPYDFNFDFQTDSALVCSELIYKAYEPAAGMRGLNLPLVEMMGRKVSLPNDMARQFHTLYGKSGQQSDLVIFLDGHEKSAGAGEADVTEFRRSWQRPKWHILTQKAPGEAMAATGNVVIP